MRILVFGDSVAQGYYDLTNGGWVNLLFLHSINARVRRKDISTEVFNVSISGNTTKDVVRRLAGEIQTRQWPQEPIMLVFAVGLNDTVIIDNQPTMHPDDYRRDLEELHNIAKQFTEDIVFIGLTPVDESESAPWLFNSGTSELTWKNQRIREFDQILEKFAQEKNIRFIPIFDDFLHRQQAGEKLHADGLHPNSMGHEIIFRKVIEEIEL